MEMNEPDVLTPPPFSPFKAAEPLQHLEPGGVCLTLLCPPGPGAPHHPLLRGPLA